MTVNITPVFDRFVAFVVTTDGHYQTIVIERRTHWPDRESLEEALKRQGYREDGHGGFEYVSTARTITRGRPPQYSLEERAEHVRSNYLKSTRRTN